MDRPDLIRSDNGGEFTAQAVREWLGELAEDPAHQTGWSMGERVQRNLQGRTAQQRHFVAHGRRPTN